MHVKSGRYYDDQHHFCKGYKTKPKTRAARSRHYITNLKSSTPSSLTWFVKSKLSIRSSFTSTVAFPALRSLTIGVDATRLNGPFLLTTFVAFGFCETVEIGRRGGIKDLISFRTSILPNVPLALEIVVEALFLLFVTGLVNAGLAVTPVSIGRRAGTETAVPGREEDAVLVPTPDVAVLFVTVGARETDPTPGCKGRAERATVRLAVEGVAVCLVPTPA